MLWLIVNDASHQITACNIHQDGDKHQLWVTRVGNKSLMVAENTDKEVVKEIKDAIDFAIEQKEPTFRLE